MATIKNITHDSGPPVSTYWNTVNDVAGRLSITNAAALNGTAYGLQIDFSSSNAAIVSEPFVNPASGEMRLRFYFDPNGAGTPASGNEGLIQVLLWDGVSFAIVNTGIFITSAGVIQVSYSFSEDGGGGGSAGTFTITDEPHCFEMSSKRATSDVSSDGEVEFLLDGVSQASATNVDNFDLFPTQDEIRLFFEAWPASMSGTTVYADEFLLTDVEGTGLCDSDTGSYVIGAAIDNEIAGTTAWLTAWRDGTLYLQRWGLPGLSKDLEISLGAATLAQVQAKSKIAYPYAGSDQTMWVFGNMDSPSFMTGTVHLIETTGAGASGTWTISLDLSSWASTDVLDSLIVTPDLDGVGTREFIAVRRRTDTAPELWHGFNALSLASVIPLPTGTGVEYRGMHMGRNASVALGTDTLGTGSNRVVSTPSPYTGTWADVTFDYPSGTVQVLRYL